MTYFWPADSTGRHDPPDDPVFQQIVAALDPIRPLLRGLSYFVDDKEHTVVVAFGAACHQTGIRLNDEALILETPIGEMYQRPAALLRLLQANYRRDWTFRVDGVTQASLVRAAQSTPAQGAPEEQELEVVVVIEHHTQPQRLPELADLILQSWREKTLNRALIQELRGELDE